MQENERKTKMKFKKTWGGEKRTVIYRSVRKSTSKIKQGRARGSTERDTHYTNEPFKKEA